MEKGFLIMLSAWVLCGLSLLLVFKAMGGMGLLYDKMGFLGTVGHHDSLRCVRNDSRICEHDARWPWYTGMGTN